MTGRHVLREFFKIVSTWITEAWVAAQKWTQAGSSQISAGSKFSIILRIPLEHQYPMIGPKQGLTVQQSEREIFCAPGKFISQIFFILSLFDNISSFANLLIATFVTLLLLVDELDGYDFSLIVINHNIVLSVVGNLSLLFISRVVPERLLCRRFQFQGINSLNQTALSG